MEIKGKVHCFFEQSGTFKNEFIKLGIPSEDYDIQNNFGETNNVRDLFKAIEDAYENKESLFDAITKDDLIIAFFPCIYFTGSTNPCYYTLENNNYRKLSLEEKLDKMLERSRDRQNFFELIIKMVGVCLKRGLRLIIENPYSTSHYLHNNFFKAPDVMDKNRTLRGDFFVKPTGYWFFNCSPTSGCSLQKDKETKVIWKCKSGKEAGLCSEERSLISPDYARNFICDFILGKEQDNSLLTLF
jgi:hypothetical protein